MVLSNSNVSLPDSQWVGKNMQEKGKQMQMFNTQPLDSTQPQENWGSNWGVMRKIVYVLVPSFFSWDVTSVSSQLL